MNMLKTDNIISINSATLDLENKVLLPTKTLYKALQTEFSALYQATRENLAELHSSIAQNALHLYRNPAVTLDEWENRALQQSDKALALFNERVVPQMEATYRQALAVADHAYRQGLADANRLSAETRDLVAALYAQPAETSERIVARLTSALHNMSAETSQLYHQVYAETAAELKASAQVLKHLHDVSAQTLTTFMDAPSATAAELYYRISAALLDFYVQGINVMVELLQKAAMPSGWSL